MHFDIWHVGQKYRQTDGHANGQMDMGLPTDKSRQTAYLRLHGEENISGMVSLSVSSYRKPGNDAARHIDVSMELLL